MRKNHRKNPNANVLLSLLATSALLGQAQGQQPKRDQETLVETKNLRSIMESNPRISLKRDQDRDLVVKQMMERAAERKAMVEVKAKKLKYPLQSKTANGVMELVDFDGDRPVYYTSRNVNAAISTGANLLQAAPYGATGTGLQGDTMKIGLWDGGPALVTHQEFKDDAGVTRVILGDRPSWTSDEHGTHVAGTMIARGVDPLAKGMAPKAKLLSYDWNSDIAEMTANGAAAAKDPTKIYLSNHSYGEGMGWHPMGTWTWFGVIEDASQADAGFGRYSRKASELDALANACPYYTVFRAVGNDDADTPPTGVAIRLSPAEGSPISYYDPAIHPPGDSVYMGGFQTMGYDDCAKNIISVGSVDDPVNGSGVRDPKVGAHTFFSSKGPTDDGRIKPDICANGWRVYSSVNRSDSSYDTFSGTSMATPNLCGSSALLIEHYKNLYNGDAMLNHTLKCLLLHTADDMGNKGPDYTFGWGLANVKAAADLLTDHKNNPSLNRLTVDTISSTKPTVTIPIIWDGVSPLKATLCWTDPAAATVTQHDSRLPQLINDLDVKILAPNGSPYMPWVMPFVDDWSIASFSKPAVTGRNKTDNTEQVYVEQPYLPGVYQVVISYTGTLKNDSQTFTLCTSGGALVQPPPPAPFSVTNYTLAFGYKGQSGTIVATGSGFRADTRAVLRRTGSADVELSNLGAGTGSDWKFGINLTGVGSGKWDLVFINPYNDVITKTDGYTVLDKVWTETFDRSSLSGWTSTSLVGTTSWLQATDWCIDGMGCVKAAHPSARSTTQLLSPVINISSSATKMIVNWNNNLSGRSDGAVGMRVEWSYDGGTTWNNINDTNSPMVVSGLTYNGTLGAGTSGSGLPAILGSRSGETVLNFPSEMVAQFAGKSMRFRWTFYTALNNSAMAYIDAFRVYCDQGTVVNDVAVSSVSPNRVTLNKSASMIVTGQNFEPGARVFFRFSTFSAFEAPVVSYLNSNTLAVQVPALNSTATRNVIVINPSGMTGQLTNGLSVVASANTTDLAIQSIAPAYSQSGQTITCTLQGQGFASGMEVHLINDIAPEIIATNVNVLSATQAEATFNFTGAIEGSWTPMVKSSSGAEVQMANGFVVVPSTTTLPTSIASVTPNSSRNTAPVRVSIKGAYFKAGSTYSLMGTGFTTVLGTSVSQVSSSQVDVTFDITGATAGTRNLVVNHTDGSSTTMVNAFTVNPAPAVYSCTPNVCYQGETIPITIKGDYFMSGATAKLIYNTNTVNVTGITVVDSQTITGTISVPSTILAGTYHVEVTNTDALKGTGTSLFTIKSTKNSEIFSASTMRMPAGKTTVITLTGANFTTGSTAQFVRNTTSFSPTVTYVSPTELTLSVTLTPTAWVGGPYTLTVTNSYGTSVSYNNFYIDAAEPSFQRMTPTTAASGSYNPVVSPRDYVLYCTNVDAVTAVKIRKAGCADISGTSLNLITSSGYVGFNLDLRGAEAGLWDVVLENATGYTQVTPKAFTVTAISGQPSLTSVSPASASQGASVNLSLTGTNFATGCTVKLKRTGLPDVLGETPVIANATSMTSAVNLAAAGPGLWDVVVTNSAGLTATLAEAFTVNEATTTNVTLTSVSPASGTVGNTVAVTMTGTNFATGCTAKLTKSGSSDIVGSATTIASATSMSASFNLTGAATGSWNVIVTNSVGQSATLTNGFTVNAGAPTLTAISPNSGNMGATVTATLTGSNFTTGCTAKLVKSGSTDIVGSSITITSSTSMSASFNLTGAASGSWSVMVTNSSNQSVTLTNGFTVNAVAPTLSAISPNSGNVGATVTATLTGANFTTGCTAKLVKSGSTDIVGSSITITSATSMSASFNLTGATTGSWNVVVTNSANQSVTLTSGFTINAAIPTLTGVSPSSGNVGSSVTTTLMGTNFATGCTAKLTKSGSTDIAGSAIAINSGTLMSATFNLTGATTGAWNVVVTNSTGQSVTLTNGFTVNAATPTLTAISPNSGTMGATVTTTFTGTNFATGCTAKLVKSGSTDIVGSAITITSATSMSAAFNLTGATSGAWDVVVTNSTGQAVTLVAGFTVNAVAPTLTAVSPNTGVVGASVTATLTGTNFATGCTAKLVQSGSTDIVGSSITITSATSMSASFNLTSASAGAYDVVVTNSTNQSATMIGGFTVNPSSMPTPKYWYKMDETAGTIANDSSGNTQHATVTGAPIWEPTGGKFGGSLKFSGTTDSIRKATTSIPAGSFTVSLWAKSAANQTNVACSVFSNTSSNSNPKTFQIDVSNGYNFSSAAGGTGSGSFGPIVNGTWVHLAAVCNGTTTDLYYNGAYVKTVTSADNNFNTIGIAINRNGVRTFNGSIDDVRVYTEALTSTQITAIYNNDQSGGAGTTPTFTDWQSGKFTPTEISSGIGSATGDYDQDGLSNLLEYAIDTDPKVHNTIGAVTKDATGVWFEFLRPQGGRSDISYSAEASADMVNWTPAILEISAAGSPEKMRVRDPLSSGDTKKRFIRLKVVPK